MPGLTLTILGVGTPDLIQHSFGKKQTQAQRLSWPPIGDLGQITLPPEVSVSCLQNGNTALSTSQVESK